MTRRKKIFVAPDHVMGKFPVGVSGNDINGLGETKKRPPSPMLWHLPGITPLLELREYVLSNYFSFPECVKAFWEPDGGRGPELNEIATKRNEATAEEWTARVKDFLLTNETDDVGITPVDPMHIYDGFSVEQPNLIMIAVHHEYELLADTPSNPQNLTHSCELGTQYARAARIAAHLKNFIHDQGYECTEYLGPDADAIAFVPHAIAAGLGELGKHGSMIHPRFGSGFRLSAVTTNMPLNYDNAIEFGGDQFCTNCQICSQACPPAAISDEKQMVRGVEKYYVDFDKCIPYFNETMGCGVCIAACPWTRPGIADNLLVKMAKKRERAANE